MFGSGQEKANTDLTGLACLSGVKRVYYAKGYYQARNRFSYAVEEFSLVYEYN